MEKVGGEEDGAPAEETTLIRSAEPKSNADNGAERGLTEMAPVNSKDEAPADWFEPLEEDCDDGDDAQSFDVDLTKDAEIESLAGESEQSSSVAGSERDYRRRGGGGGGGGGVVRGRRRPHMADESWEDCPVLGQGWKRKEVLRRSGLSIGQKDVYYLSPVGDRVRSRIELLKYVGNTMDLSKFDFKTGQFSDIEHPKKAPKRKRKEPSVDCGFSSESSVYNDAADAQDRTYSPGPLFSLCISAQQSSKQSYIQKVTTASISSSGKTSQTASVPALLQDGLALLPPNAIIGICVRCRNSFTGVKGQTMCDTCREACKASKDTRKIAFRKWLPCGFCGACQLTKDCGMCGSCVNVKKVQNQKPVRCRMRKCLSPSLKKPRPWERSSNRNIKPPELDFKDSQYSDSDDKSTGHNEDDDDDDDDYEGFLRKTRRPCGVCKGCTNKTDCGSCDYCLDKPKFGGSNKKRQKCRQRRCHRDPKALLAHSRDRPRRTDACNKLGNANTNGQVAETKTGQAIADNQHLHDVCGKWSGEEDRRSSRSPENPADDLDEDNMEPTITQLFSLGDEDPVDIDLDLELLELLSSLRDTMLPMLWCAVLAEGPCVQLLQCSKRSAMADTAVQIEPSFRYHVSVQGQPLLPTHRLYRDHPAHLTSVTQVVALLEDLERYTVCRGFKREAPQGPEPVVQVRAATCEFLVGPEDQRCIRCKSSQQKQ